MITPTAGVLIVFGIIALVGGYGLFRSMLPLWGFLLCGWMAFTFLPFVVRTPQADTLLFQGVAFVAGGLIGAVIAGPLYYVIIFLSGAILGGLAGAMVGAIVDIGGFTSFKNVMAFANLSFPPVIQSNTQIVFLVIFGVILGAAALNFQKFMIIASSSFVGSAALVSGLVGPITSVGSSDMNRAGIMLMAWLLLAVLGMILQFRISGEA